MHDGMPYGRNQGQGQGHAREVNRQSSTGLIFPGGPTLAGTRMSPFWILLEDDGGGGDNWSYDICKAALKLSLPTNQHPVLFIGQMSFLSPNQQCQSTGENGKHCDRLDEGNCSQGSQCQTVRVEPRGGGEDYWDPLFDLE